MTSEPGSKLWDVLHEMNNAIDRLRQHKAVMESGQGVPRDPEARSDLIISGTKMLKKIAKEVEQACDELLADYEKSRNN